MLKHRDICTATCGDTRGTKSPFDTACVDSEGHYNGKLVIFNRHLRWVYDHYNDYWY
jgi:hypothetical protein